MRPQGLHHVRVDFHDYQVDLLDLDGRGLYNLGYRTFDKEGRTFADWQTAKLYIPKEQRAALWPAILKSLDDLVKMVQPPRIFRRIPTANLGQHRDTDLTDVLTKQGYREVKRFELGQQLFRHYAKD